MNYKHLIITSALMVMTIAQVFGKNFTVSGSIADGVSKEKLLYANVVIVTNDSANKTVSYTTTDENGNFELKNVPSGEYLIKTTYSGYGVCTHTLVVKGDEQKMELGTLSLISNSHSKSIVEVTAKKTVDHQKNQQTL